MVTFLRSPIVSRITNLWQWLERYPAPEKSLWTRRCWVALGAVTLAAVFFCGYFILYLTQGHQAYQTNAEDLGIMDQALWNTVHGQFLHQTICNIISDTNCVSEAGIMRFAIHFEPILLPISLLYLVFPDPRTLLVLQTMVVALGAYPAFLLARRRLQHTLLAVILAWLYLLYPAQQQATVSDFHAVTFTSTLLLFTIYFMYTRRTLWMFVFAFLAIACKEEISLVIVMLGLWSIILQHRWRSGLVLVIVGLLWFFLVVYVIMPYFSPTGHPLLITRFDSLGQGPLQIAFSIVHHPLAFLRQYIFESEHRAYLRILFIPALFLPLLAPWVTIIALPSILLNLISSDSQMYSGLFHYNAEIVPVLLFATIEAIVMLTRLVRSLLLILASYVGTGLAPISANLYQLAFKGGIFNRRGSGLSLPCSPIRLLTGQGQAAAPTDSFFVRRLVLKAQGRREALGDCKGQYCTIKGTICGVATGDRKGREGASPSSTQRCVDVPQAASSCRGVDDELASSRPLRSPVPVAHTHRAVRESDGYPRWGGYTREKLRIVTRKGIPLFIWRIEIVWLMVLLSLTLASSLHYDFSFHSNLPLSSNFTWPNVSPHAVLAQQFVQAIPPTASVSAQSELVPHISERRDIYLFPYASDSAEYIFLDTTGDIYPCYSSSAYERAVRVVLSSGHYGIVAWDDGLILLKRGLSPPTTGTLDKIFSVQRLLTIGGGS